jgi:hypothetical protein
MGKRKREGSGIWSVVRLLILLGAAEEGIVLC